MSGMNSELYCIGLLSRRHVGVKLRTELSPGNPISHCSGSCLTLSVSLSFFPFPLQTISSDFQISDKLIRGIA